MSHYKKGDWNCSCGEVNFSSRSQCRRCNSHKPSDQGKQGDWHCICGELNFASRAQCRKCSTPKPMMDVSLTSSKLIDNNKGDWNCSCGELNFASRTQCRKCGNENRVLSNFDNNTVSQYKDPNTTSKNFTSGNVLFNQNNGNMTQSNVSLNHNNPFNQSYDNMTQSNVSLNQNYGNMNQSNVNINSGNMTQNNVDSKQGDWNCSCGELNFASRTQCRKCGAQKFNSSSNNVSEWNCMQCGVPNDKLNNVCNRCGSEKVNVSSLQFTISLNSGNVPTISSMTTSGNISLNQNNGNMTQSNIPFNQSYGNINQGNVSFNQNYGNITQSNVSPNPGDWKCFCGEMNFALSSHCRKCGSENQIFLSNYDNTIPQYNVPTNSSMNFTSGNALLNQNNGNMTQSNIPFNQSYGNVTQSNVSINQNMTQSNIPIKQGDWNCSCGELNFASRTQCRKCYSQKPSYLPTNSSTNYTSGNVLLNQNNGNMNQSNVPFKQGDWNCSCGELNFASRTQCRKCGASSSQINGNITQNNVNYTSGNVSLNQNGNMTQSNPNFKQGDWNCSCGELNFASRSQCRKCGFQKLSSSNNKERNRNSGHRKH